MNALSYSFVSAISHRLMAAVAKFPPASSKSASIVIATILSLEL
jgi:hypothetical protein